MAETTLKAKIVELEKAVVQIGNDRNYWWRETQKLQTTLAELSPVLDGRKSLDVTGAGADRGPTAAAKKRGGEDPGKKAPAKAKKSDGRCGPQWTV